MANVKFTELDAAAPLSMSDILAIVQASTSKKATLRQVSTLLSRQVLNTQTASYTLVLTDAGKYIRMNAAGGK